MAALKPRQLDRYGRQGDPARCQGAVRLYGDPAQKFFRELKNSKKNVSRIFPVRTHSRTVTALAGTGLPLFAAAGFFHAGFKPVEIGPGYTAERGTYFVAVSRVDDGARFAVARSMDRRLLRRTINGNIMSPGNNGPGYR
jgi:hypothetical protein